MTAQTSTERAGAIAFRGAPMTLVGPLLRAGEPAPDFSLTSGSLEAINLNEVVDNGKRAALLIVVPSLDTGVCSTETKTFSARIAELPKIVAPYVVSMDLPFAQSRWSGEHGVHSISFLSDYRDHGFGKAYGVLIKELELLSRAVFLIAPDRTIAYAQIVSEVTHEPDYDKVFAAAKKLA